MRWLILSLMSWHGAVFAQADLPDVESYPHARVHSETAGAVVDYELGLGALQKVKGRWRMKHSERIQGKLTRRTWQIDEGYTAEEAYQWYALQMEAIAELLFQCQGRDCGSSAQWANRKFQQRVLYGHDQRQLYSAWRLQQQGALCTVVLYAVDRGDRRHYVHLDRLVHGAEAAPRQPRPAAPPSPISD